MCTPTTSLPDFQGFELKMQRIVAEYVKATSRQTNGDQTMQEAENQRKAILDLVTSFQILLADVKVFFTKYELETRQEQLRCSYQRFSYEKAHLRRLKKLLSDPDTTLLLEPTPEESQPIPSISIRQLVNNIATDQGPSSPARKKLRLSPSPDSTAARNEHQCHAGRCITISPHTLITPPRRKERLSCGTRNSSEASLPADVGIKTEHQTSGSPITEKVSPSAEKESTGKDKAETGSNAAESIHIQTSEKNIVAPSAGQCNTAQAGPSNDKRTYDSQNEPEKHVEKFRIPKISNSKKNSGCEKFREPTKSQKNKRRHDDPDAVKDSNTRNGDWDKYREKATSQEKKRDRPPTKYSGDAKADSVTGDIAKKETPTSTLQIAPSSSKPPEPDAKKQTTEQIIKMITSLEGKPSEIFNFGKIKNTAKKVKIAPYIPLNMPNLAKNVKVAPFLPQNCSTPLPDKDCRIPVGIENQTTDISEIPHISKTNDSIPKNDTDLLQNTNAMGLQYY